MQKFAKSLEITLLVSAKAKLAETLWYAAAVNTLKENCGSKKPGQSTKY